MYNLETLSKIGVADELRHELARGPNEEHEGGGCTVCVPDTALYQTLKGLAPEVYVAGTSTAVGHAIEGIGQAFEVAMMI